MFDIEINGNVDCANRGLNWGVARGVIEWALRFNKVRIFWDGAEISIEDFNQIPGFSGHQPTPRTAAFGEVDW
jgi:hypothetical protein